MGRKRSAGGKQGLKEVEGYPKALTMLLQVLQLGGLLINKYL